MYIIISFLILSWVQFFPYKILAKSFAGRCPYDNWVHIPLDQPEPQECIGIDPEINEGITMAPATSKKALLVIDVSRKDHFFSISFYLLFNLTIIIFAISCKSHVLSDFSQCYLLHIFVMSCNVKIKSHLLISGYGMSFQIDTPPLFILMHDEKG